MGGAHSGIVVQQLTKEYDRKKALKDVTITFEHGKIYGLLGRNGAGKSSLLNIITNRIFPSSGSVAIDGIPSKENDRAQRKVYMMSEAMYYPRAMRFTEVLRWTEHFYGSSFDRERAKKLCEVFQFPIKNKFGQLSTGYCSIAKIIVALSLHVPYVLLDEPVLGLDANHRDVFYRELLHEAKERPRMFIVSTHLIEEVATVVQEIVLIRRGEIVRTQSIEHMLKEGYTVTGPASVIDAFVAKRSIIGTDVIGGIKIAYVLGSYTRNEIPPEIEVSRMDLQKLFLHLTKDDAPPS
jgi:ABC-2 type transport system ATP-binding protein